MDAVKDPIIYPYWTKVFDISLGLILIFIGFTFGLLPIIPGWLFTIPGLLLLAKHIKWVKRIVDRGKELWIYLVRYMKIKEIIFVLGLSALLSGYIMFTNVFIKAYRSGGRAVVDINSVGEANIELVIIIITLPFVVYTLLKIIRKSKEEEKGD